MKLEDVKENMLIRRRGAKVSWIVWYVDRKSRLVRIFKNEGKPLSHTIKEKNLKNWEKRIDHCSFILK